MIHRYVHIYRYICISISICILETRELKFTRHVIVKIHGTCASLIPLNTPNHLCWPGALSHFFTSVTEELFIIVIITVAALRHLFLFYAIHSLLISQLLNLFQLRLLGSIFSAYIISSMPHNDTSACSGCEQRLPNEEFQKPNSRGVFKTCHRCRVRLKLFDL